ncbi:MAG: hypothetical protein HOK25_14905 [Rhodospirillaceae bacterium]|nr:hypothetical protein [Rhodospirillaceae bacterium]
MPAIHIEIPEWVATDIKKRIREGAKQAVLDTLAVKESKFTYVAVREVYGVNRRRGAADHRGLEPRARTGA